MATYTKLKSGEWGIRSTSPVEPGSRVTVATKTGGSKTETVKKIIWSGNGVWLAAIAQRERMCYCTDGTPHVFASISACEM